MALALDGHVHSSPSGSISVTTVTLTTTNANDIIYLVCEINGGAGITILSVSSPNTSGWTVRATGGVSQYPLVSAYGIAASALSSEVITVTLNGTASFWTLDAFGVSGANTSTPFDSNGSIPQVSSGSVNVISTNNANDFLIGAFRDNLNPAIGAGSGWTLINTGDYQLVQYQVVSSTQSSLSVVEGAGSACNGAIADAIVAAGVVILPGILMGQASL